MDNVLLITEDGIKVIPDSDGNYQYYTAYTVDYNSIYNRWSWHTAPNILNINKVIPHTNEVCDRLGIKRFSSEASARKYILINKPCLSINDFLSIGSMSNMVLTLLFRIVSKRI